MSKPGQIWPATEGCEAVIHLTTIPSPVYFPEEVFVNSTRTTLHALHATVGAGARRATIASSVSTRGMA